MARTSSEFSSESFVSPCDFTVDGYKGAATDSDYMAGKFRKGEDVTVEFSEQSCIWVKTKSDSVCIPIPEEVYKVLASKLPSDRSVLIAQGWVLQTFPEPLLDVICNKFEKGLKAD